MIQRLQKQTKSTTHTHTAMEYWAYRNLENKNAKFRNYHFAYLAFSLVNKN